jgi:hypothetical protein
VKGEQSDAVLLERIRAHCRKWGLTPDGPDHNVADVIEQGFVSHCAIDVCSAANQPGSHWCRRHANFVTDLLKRAETVAKEEHDTP